MTAVLARGSRGESRENAVRVRGPAYAVMIECLRIQSTAPRQSWGARLFGRDPIRPDARSWYRGALGEIAVVKMLTSLPAEWTVLRAGMRADADHVVIGPAGVFTITTKNHSGQRIWVGDDRLLVNGHRTNHIRDARWEASRVSRLLGAGDDGPVTPIIAIVDPGILSFDQSRPAGVLVIAADRLRNTLTRRTREVSGAAIAELVRMADESGAWRRPEAVLDDTLRHEARFARLKAEVDAARWRRGAWVLLGVLAVVASLGVLLVTVVACSDCHHESQHGRNG
jgi:hypothetical protein